MVPRTSLSLYLHIPFCRHRCGYCDFNTYTTIGELQTPYVAALGQEIRQVAGKLKRPAHTVYLGGGTPSLLSPEQLRVILKAIDKSFNLATTVEITLEANPDALSQSYLEKVRILGVNRLSLGVQSAQGAELALLEREHNFNDVVQAVYQSRVAGFNNLNLDLIYGLPEQSLASWENTLDAVLELEPEHLSLYCLTIEPGTPFHRRMISGHLATPDPDLAADQYTLARTRLEDVGYVHYEISNWARPGKECRHNLTYWRNEEYLGLGAGSHGHAGGYRYEVVKQPRVYIKHISSGVKGQFPWSAAVSSAYKLSLEEARADTIITQLRLLKEGLDLNAFQSKFGRTLSETYPGTIDKLIEWDLVKLWNDRLLLSERGELLSNQVFYRFM